MAVSINKHFASLAVRAQDEVFEKDGGKTLKKEQLLLTDFGRIEEQRFVGFTGADGDGGIVVDVRCRLRLFVPQREGPPVQLPDLIARICEGQKDEVILSADIVDSWRLMPFEHHWHSPVLGIDIVRPEPAVPMGGGGSIYQNQVKVAS